MSQMLALVLSSVALAAPVDLRPAAAPTPVPTPMPTPSIAPADLGEPLEPPPAPPGLPDLTLDHEGGFSLTLEQSIRLAIAGATNVLKATNAEKVTGAALLQSYGQFLPNVTAQANYGYNKGNQYYTTGAPTYVTGSNVGAGYTLAATLNLFNGLSDYTGLRSSLLREDAAKLSLFRAKQSVALDVAQSFLQVILDQRLVGIARKNLQESEARQKLLSEQTNVGARNLSDLFRQQAQTSLDESLLLTTENKARTDQIVFLQKLRVDVTKNYHFVDPASPVEKSDPRYEDEQALLSTAMAKRADLKSSENTASAAHFAATSSLSGYMPRIDLTGSMVSGGHTLFSQNVNGVPVVPGTQESMGYQLDTQVEYGIGVFLTWNLFDRFVTNENIARARVTADNADIDEQDNANQVKGDVKQAYGNYETSIAQLRSSKKGVDAAQKAYEVIEGRYEVGSATFIDLITAQATLLQAQTVRAQALIDFTLQAKSVEFATGELAVD